MDLVITSYTDSVSGKETKIRPIKIKPGETKIFTLEVLKDKVKLVSVKLKKPLKPISWQLLDK